MSTIAKTFGVREIVGAKVGLELEIEGERLPSFVNEDWDVKADGSLRGGLEYVFSQPLGSVNTKAALESLAQCFKDNRSVLDYSFRTSTHVHVNVSNLSLDVTKAIIVLFHLFEDEYINFCARSRKSNRFCLGMKDGDGVLHNIRGFLNTNAIPRIDSGKYSAMNLCTLSTFGTLEFRTLEGTDNWERIYTWVRVLLALRKAGKDLGTPKAVMGMKKEDLAALLFPTERLKNTFLKEGWEGRYEMNHSVGWDAFYKVA